MTPRNNSLWPVERDGATPKPIQFSLATLLGCVIFCVLQLALFSGIIRNIWKHDLSTQIAALLWVALSSLAACAVVIWNAGRESLRIRALTFVLAFIGLLFVNLSTSGVLMQVMYHSPNSGRAETAAVACCKAFSTAEDIYKRQNYSHDLVPHYAQTLQDLYESKPGAGDLALIDRSFFAAERSQKSPTPKFGYFFKVLRKQGSNARGGAFNYIENGKMTKGYALIAFPAANPSANRRSYITSHDGIVYETDLGANTASIVESMTEFNPDPKKWEISE